MAGRGFVVKEIAMIVQNTTHIAPAIQAELRTNAAASVESRPAATAEAGNPSGQPSVEELQGAVSVINKVLELSNNNLQFSVDADTDRLVVKLVDTSTGELIRQYPSEATLAISRDIDRIQRGMLLTQKV
jgi:flagellar protein FlaG